MPETAPWLRPPFCFGPMTLIAAIGNDRLTCLIHPKKSAPLPEQQVWLEFTRNRDL